MVTRGKNINLFLIDGEASGRIKCTMDNWVGIAYKIPRTELERCQERDDLKQSGVYFLFGVSEKTGKDIVYVGQAGARKSGEGILNRLKEHKRNPDKGYWHEAVVFTTTNNYFGATEISYLENRFRNIAMDAKRYDVKNVNEPNLGNIREEQESELEEFIDYAKVIMGTLGHKVFVPLTKSAFEKKNDEHIDITEKIFYFKRKSKKSNKIIEAICKQTNDGFVVLQGSHIEIIDSHTIPATIKAARKKANIDDNNILQEDILFKSPSYAAAFVIGGHVNGLVSWKTKDGKTLKDIEEE